MGLGIPPLNIKITLESNPLKSRLVVRRLAVDLHCGRSSPFAFRSLPRCRHLHCVASPLAPKYRDVCKTHVFSYSILQFSKDGCPPFLSPLSHFPRLLPSPSRRVVRRISFAKLRRRLDCQPTPPCAPLLALAAQTGSHPSPPSALPERPVPEIMLYNHIISYNIIY